MNNKPKISKKESLLVKICKENLVPLLTETNLYDLAAARQVKTGWNCTHGTFNYEIFQHKEQSLINAQFRVSRSTYQNFSVFL